jgi:hypothetical protein
LNRLAGREPPVEYDPRVAPLEHKAEHTPQSTPKLYARLNTSALQLLSVKSEPAIKIRDTRTDFERHLDDLTNKTRRRKVVDRWKIIKAEMGIKVEDYRVKVEGWKVRK